MAKGARPPIFHKPKTNSQTAATLQAQFQQALTLHQQGRLANAEAIYKAVLKVHPQHFDALHLLGVIELQRKNPQAAAKLIGRAIAINPNSAAAHNNLGNALRDLKQHEETLASYDRALAIKPDYAEALYNRGATLHDLKRHQEALTSYDRALAIKPKDDETLINRGNVLRDLKQHEEALASYDRALAIKPDNVKALINRGNTLQDLKRYQDALVSYDRALAIRPDYAEALYNRGAALHDLWRHEDALASYDKALSIKPDYAEAWSNRGVTLGSIGERLRAIESHQEAINLNPHSTTYRFRYLMAYIPVLATANENIEMLREQFAHQIELLGKWLVVNEVNDAHEAVGAAQPFYLAYQDKNNKNLLGQYGKLCTRLMLQWQTKNNLLPNLKMPDERSKIKLGIVSAQIRNHSVWNAFVKGWFQQLNQNIFEIHVFYLNCEQDAETTFAKANAKTFEYGDKRIEEWSKLIIEKNIEILIYPELGMDITTPKLASMRLAPVQIAAWGHPETTGLSTMDYYLSAADFENAKSQECYTERLVNLPNLGCYFDSADVPDVELDLRKLGINPDLPLFVCPGTPFKYMPEHDKIFVEIVQRIQNAQFIFFTYQQAPLLSKALFKRLSETFKAADLDFLNYAVFIPWQPKPEFYSIMRQADVLLDTLGFSGFNTTIQAVECSLPIVTCEGRFMRGRFASAILKRMGLLELVASTEEDYISLAIKLAQDKTYRQFVSARIKELRPILFNDLEPIRALEEFLIGTSRPH